MRFCLNKSDVRSVIDERTGLSSIKDEHLKSCIEGAKNWSLAVSSLNYLFAIVLERKKKLGHDCDEAIQAYSQLSEEMNFEIQTHTMEFLDFMLRNISDRSLSLEDRLIRIQTNLSNFEFSKTVRIRI